MSWGSDDRGSTHVLEAVIIASIMVSAVAFVATYETPDSGWTATRAPLAQKAEDALAILYDTPVSGSSFGDNLLSVFLAKCLNGNCTLLEERLDRLLPEGSAYALYVSNGYDTFPVIERLVPEGEAVTATQLLEPKWSHTFVAAATSAVSSSNEPLVVYSLPIFNSNPTSSGGSPLLIKAEGTRLSDNSDYTLTAYYSTYAPPTSAAHVWPAASLYFVDGSGAPLATTDVRSLTLDSFGDLTRTNVSFTLRLEESASVAIPVGAEISVLMPRGWEASADPAENAGTWLVTANATDRNSSYTGATIRAELLQVVNNSHVDFHFDARYQGDLLDYYPFHATLARGAQSTADLIVRADEHAGTPAHATPMIAAAVPRPMGATAETVWTLGIYAPYNNSDTTGYLSEAVRIRSVEIVEANGDSIFGDVTVIDDGGGDWTSGATTLVWAGRHDLHHDSPLNLTFRVQASGSGGEAMWTTPFEAPVGFDGWNASSIGRIAPGFQRAAFLPADDDYEGYAGAEDGLVQERVVRSDPIYRSTLLPGASTYSVGLSGDIEDSLHGSYVQVDERMVPIGGDVVIDSNVQSVLFALAEAGQRAGVTMRFYPPWSGDERVPIWEQSSLDAGILDGDVTAIALHDLTEDAHPDPIVGTSNGRVLAFNAVTGQRIPGGSFTVPLINAGQGVAPAPVSHLEMIDIAGEPYIVVGTMEPSSRIFVLNESFESRWSTTIQGMVEGVDTSVDIDGDGRKDIVVASADANSYVYVLRALEASTALHPHDPGDASTYQAFYERLVAGEARGLVGLAQAGPEGEGAGLAVGIQTLLEPSVSISFDPTDPLATNVEQNTGALPRAGLQQIDAEGNETSTMFGSPVSLGRPYDYDADGVTDVVAGGAAGYVYMLNGRAFTQPLYSYVINGVQTIVDGQTEDSVRAYALTDDGQILYTDDGWLTVYCTACEVYIPSANALASNRTASIWAVGEGNLMWQSVLPPWHDNEAPSTTMPGLLMMPVVPSVTKEGLAHMLTESYNLTDVHFGPDPDEGWVVGYPYCSLPLTDCPEALVMRTIDGGVTWTAAALGDAGTSLATWEGQEVRAKLSKIYFDATGRGWIVGEAGTLLRSSDGLHWTGLEPFTAAWLRDVSCSHANPDWCIVVGDDGTAFATTNATATYPGWTALPLEDGVATRDLFSVGVLSDGQALIGTSNMVLKTWDEGVSWSALPMNYIENDGRVINVNADGSGYVLGGGPANARIWFLHDYGIRSVAETVSLDDELETGARVTGVSLLSSNATISFGGVEVMVATNGENWKSMGFMTAPGILDPLADARDYRLDPVTFSSLTSGDDLRFEFRFNTSGDKTITTPHVRNLSFQVDYTAGGTPGSTTLDIAFDTDAWKDPVNTTATWDTAAGVLRQPYIEEYWTRNVTGAVLDLQVGEDVNADGHEEIWVATGGILASNSPDHVIYAGVDEDTVIGEDNRVHILDGATGRILASSVAQTGNVSMVRLADPDGDGDLDQAYAIVEDDADGFSSILSFHPTSLAVEQVLSLGAEDPFDVQVGAAGPDDSTAYVGTGLIADKSSSRHIWAFNGTTGAVEWRSVPSEMGEYLVSVPIPRDWLFGAYVVEVEVEWEETITGASGDETILRSARFYDYFMVTPPDSLRPPSPIYNVHLVAWFQDWG